MINVVCNGRNFTLMRLMIVWRSFGGLAAVLRCPPIKITRRARVQLKV